jgi:hypothetical protein
LLGLDPDDGSLEMREECVYTLILRPRWTCRVEEAEDDVSIMQRVIGFSIYAFIDIIGFLASILLSSLLVDTRCVEKYDLEIFFFIGKYPSYRTLSRLGAWRYRTDFLTDESIYECGFSSIGTTDDGDISDFRHRMGL